MKKRCKHKNHEDRNHEIGGWNIPEGCLTHYDIYCADCGEKLGSWDFGYSDVEENLYFSKWYNRLLYNLKYKIRHIFDKKIDYNDNPFDDFDDIFKENDEKEEENK